MKILYICQKHYNQLIKKIKQKDPLPLGATINYGAIGYLYGERFTVYIKSYLKKIRIIPVPKFPYLEQPQSFFNNIDRQLLPFQPADLRSRRIIATSC